MCFLQLSAARNCSCYVGRSLPLRGLTTCGQFLCCDQSVTSMDINAYILIIWFALAAEGDGSSKRNRCRTRCRLRTPGSVAFTIYETRSLRGSGGTAIATVETTRGWVAPAGQFHRFCSMPEASTSLWGSEVIAFMCRHSFRKGWAQPDAALHGRLFRLISASALQSQLERSSCSAAALLEGSVGDRTRWVVSSPQRRPCSE